MSLLAPEPSFQHSASLQCYQRNTNQELGFRQFALVMVGPKTLLLRSLTRDSVDFVVFDSSDRGPCKGHQFPFLKTAQEEKKKLPKKKQLAYLLNIGIIGLQMTLHLRKGWGADLPIHFQLGRLPHFAGRACHRPSLLGTTQKTWSSQLLS